MAGETFGRTADGQAVTRFTLARGLLTVRLLDYGGIVAAIETPDRDGTAGNVVLGLASVADYETRSPHFGGLIGRFANRIANGRFAIDGHAYALPINEPPNAMHGGPRGFDRRMWRVDSADDNHLTLARRSPDGEEGFPGNLDLAVTYSLPEDGMLRIDYRAQTDRPTVLNLTNHSYFNLAGEGAGDVMSHEVAILADAVLETDATQIPTGARRPVEGTAFDFRAFIPLGRHIRAGDPQLVVAKGYDHCFVLRDASGQLRPAASCIEPSRGRRLDIATTLPGLQLYSGNSLDGTLVGPSGRIYRSGDAICFETQGFPDAPNHPSFPSAVLRPGERFSSTTTYRFSTV